MRIAQRFNVRFQSATSRKSRRGGGKFNPTDQAVFSGGYSQRPEPRRGVMFVVKLGHLAVFLLFSAGRRRTPSGTLQESRQRRPAENKRRGGLVIVCYKHCPPTGFWAAWNRRR